LLLEDVPLKLLLCDSLTRASEGSGLNSLTSDLLLGKLALTSDVSHRLLHRSIFKGAHELERRLGRKPCDTLPCGAHAEVGGFHQLALSFSSGRTRTICSNVCTGDATACGRLNARRRTSKCRLARSYLTWDLAREIARCPEGFLQSSYALFGQRSAALEERLVGADALPRDIKRTLLVGRKTCDLLFW
jgi:hypothetical protein